MGQVKAVVVEPRSGFKTQLGMDARRFARAHKKLVIPPALAQHKLLQAFRFEHPAQHLEKSDQCGFTRPVGPNQHGKLRQLQILDAAQAAEALNGDGLDSRWLGLALLHTRRSKIRHYTSSTLHMCCRNSGSIWRSLATSS